MSNQRYDKGTEVKWEWGEGWDQGEIVEVFTEATSVTFDGTEVTRQALQDDPAYLIEKDNGDRVLKSHSEVQKAN